MEKSVARLEGAYEHVATKSDIAGTKADIAETKAQIAALAAKVQLLQWITGIGFTIIAGRIIHFLG